MPLQQLVLNGFKSFADKTTIRFNNGITGIVGPNGSGKSNITEAIRWVMGEGSAKSLRGENMKDVIFAGSQMRAPMNHAEVELVFYQCPVVAVIMIATATDVRIIFFLSFLINLIW